MSVHGAGRVSFKTTRIPSGVRVFFYTEFDVRSFLSCTCAFRFCGLRGAGAAVYRTDGGPETNDRRQSAAVRVRKSPQGRRAHSLSGEILPRGDAVSHLRLGGGLSISLGRFVSPARRFRSGRDGHFYADRRGRLCLRVEEGRARSLLTPPW